MLNHYCLTLFILPFYFLVHFMSNVTNILPFLLFSNENLSPQEIEVRRKGSVCVCVCDNLGSELVSIIVKILSLVLMASFMMYGLPP